MADVQEKILSKYEIDITQENLFKLYKIDSIDISDAELAEKFSETRKRWEQSINGANEKNAKRDQERLDKADKYESILKDSKLRKELFNFYNGNNAGESQSNSSSKAVPTNGVDFAKEFFSLVQTTKKLKQEDVDFFFDYYQSQRKNKKAIYEMLEKDFKIAGLKKKNADVEQEEIDPEKIDGKEKDESSPLIVNLFTEGTVLRLNKCLQNYEKVVSNSEVIQKYPMVKEGLYYFLELKSVDSIEQFKELVTAKSNEVYSVRQEKGVAFTPLVDALNGLKDLSKFSDVVDNMTEFILLIKYPNLTPYMYEFLNMKNDTVKEFFGIAKRDYSFRDETDFILNYFKPVHDNFNIDTSGISSILRKAEKKARSNKILNEIDEKLGRKTAKRLPFVAGLIHCLVYWPIFAVYFVFEVLKAVITEIHKFAVPIFIVLFIATNWILPKITGVENLWYLRKIFLKSEWLSYLSHFQDASIGNTFEAIVLSLMVILLTALIYILPPFFVAWFVKAFSDQLRQRYDWMGLERTFQQIFEKLKLKTEKQYSVHPKVFVKKNIAKIIVNFVSLAIVIAIIYYLPIGFKVFSEKTGYFQKSEVTEYSVEESSGISVAEDNGDNNVEQEEILMEITASSGNIRTGVGVDYDIIMTAQKGDTFVATGKEDKASNGRTWYEIYLDDEKVETGWASEKIIKKQ